MADLAGGNQILHGAGDVLDRHVGIDAVLIEQVDHLDVQPLQRSVRHRLDVLGPAVQRPVPLGHGPDVEPELGRDHDLVAHRRQRLADQFLVDIGAIDLSGVEEGDAALDRAAQYRDALRLLERRAVGEAQAHAAEADRRDFEVAVAEFAFLHDVSPHR